MGGGALGHPDGVPVGWMESTRVWFAWLSAAGLAFWFLVGFPFGNHNESYYWIARFEHEPVWTIMVSKTLTATPRPLGQGLAYVGWQLSGGSTWAIQVFNFVLAAVALCATALVIRETRTFSVAAVVAGAGFFGGYVYLFHLHGIFYSPVLAVVAALLYFHEAAPRWRAWADLAALACALAVGLLFHPYALILFVGYAAGLVLERRREPASECLRPALLAIPAGIALVALRPAHQALSYDNLRALLASYALTELTPLLAALSAVLAAATVISVPGMTSRLRWSVAGVTVVCSAAAFASGVPVVLLWVVAAIAKAVYRGAWTLAGMTGAASLLPSIAASGSPTYAIFVILMCTIGLASGWIGMERTLERLSARWLLPVLLLVVLLVGVLRFGVEVPLVSRLARPLLAEREKTVQLETIVAWMLGSEYRTWHLALEDSVNPVDAGQSAVDRRTRPPTYQAYLDAYLASRRGAESDRRSLVVTFGNRPLDGRTLVKTVPGRFASSAMVFR